jgi:hypothetical protein
MVYLDKLMFIAYSVLIGAINSYNATAMVNGQPIGLTPSYSSGTITLTGSFSLPSQTNSLQILVYFGNYEVDSIQISQSVPAGSYTIVYVLTIQDSTNIINNAIGLSITSQLSSVSISTNANYYDMTFTGFMITFYLIYQSYPSSVSITVKFNNSITGSYSASVPSLPSGYNELGWVIPVTFY